VDGLIKDLRTGESPRLEAIEDQPDIYDIYRKYWGLYNSVSLREYRIDYALQMELVDQVIGIFIQKLKALGLYGYRPYNFVDSRDRTGSQIRWALACSLPRAVYTAE
jgi:hypothetical protein